MVIRSPISPSVELAGSYSFDAHVDAVPLERSPPSISATTEVQSGLELPDASRNVKCCTTREGKVITEV